MNVQFRGIDCFSMVKPIVLKAILCNYFTRLQYLSTNLKLYDGDRLNVANAIHASVIFR